jgi:hypothetical protein
MAENGLKGDKMKASKILELSTREKMEEVEEVNMGFSPSPAE